jgi:hypothetical protein
MGFLPFASGGGANIAPATISDLSVTMAWSDPLTWSGRLPGPRDVVQVPAGRKLLIDQDVDVSALEIAGEVSFAERDIRVECDGILVTGNGVLRAGSPEQPFAHRLTIVLGCTPERELIDGLGSKFLAAVDGGRIELNGPRRTSWVMLGDAVAPGAIVLRLSEAVDWVAGDRIAVASGGPELPLVEERTVFGISPDGLHLTLDAPMQHRHLGQHGRVRNALPGAIGRVALLSRTIVVEGDASAARNSLGAHCIVAGHAPGEPFPENSRGSVGSFTGVEFRRMGQFNRSGRYPLYWHANGDVPGNQMVDCVVHSSFQRGVVVAETRGVKIHGNVVHKPLGHGFIVDQADQAQDVATMLSTNLTIRPRRVRFADPAMRDLYERRPRSLWISDSRRPIGEGVPEA